MESMATDVTEEEIETVQIQYATLDHNVHTVVKPVESDDEEYGEHLLLKRPKLEEDHHDVTDDGSQSLKDVIFSVNKAICLRLDAIERKLEGLNERTRSLEEKVDKVIIETLAGVDGPLVQSTKKNTVIVGLPEKAQSNPGSSPTNGDVIQGLGPNVTLITLNSEVDFPSGSWLGDEKNVEMRVRVPITPSDMLHIHSNCRTPEKMGLTLLDYLFDRDTQAFSNLSGTGRHGKKQLDPLMIYGIRCHLIHRFGITEQDWHRIKLNIDSKCRTAFRRKMKGLPLTVKAFRGKAPPTYVHVPNCSDEYQVHNMDSHSDDSFQEAGELQISGDAIDMTGGIVSAAEQGGAQILQTAGGEIQVLHATPEQVAQLQQTHQIQILQGDQIIGQIQPDGADSGIQVTGGVSSANTDGTLQIITSSSGVIQVSQDE